MKQTTGRPTLVSANLPTVKTITAATNASPVVITTATNHGLQTNDIVVVLNVAGNLGANGVYPVGTVTPTTAVLTGSVGSGAYTSGGTAQNACYGITVPIPVDLTDAMRAGAINIGYEALLDRTAYLLYRAAYANVYRNGGSSSAETGHEFGGTWVFDAGSLVGTLHRTQKAVRVALTDADHTVAYAAGSGVTSVGTRFELPDSAATRTITLKSTTVVPVEGEIYEFFFPGTFSGSGAGSVWAFVRQDATNVATFVMSAAAGGRMNMAAEFEFVSGVWRLGMNSGSWTDLGGGADYGVVPGAGQ